MAFGTKQHGTNRFGVPGRFGAGRFGEPLKLKIGDFYLGGIVTYLDALGFQRAKTVEAIERQIDLLVEHRQALITAAGATIGGVFGARLVQVIDPKILRVLVLLVGSALTIGLFLRAYSFL